MGEIDRFHLDYQVAYLKWAYGWNQSIPPRLSDNLLGMYL